MSKRISIVLPAYNEENNIKIIYNSIKDVSKKINYELTIYYVNDGSSDKTWDEIEKIAKKDKSVRGINFSRNFGHQAAIEAGLKACVGDAVIMLDCDGQHPVDLIPDLIRRWEAGYEIVNTIRKETKNASYFKSISSNLFYSLINKFSETKIIAGSADFRLLDRSVIDVLNELPEQSKFYRGLVSWIGFSVDYVEYIASERISGRSSYTLKRMYKFATDGLTGFSNFPLRVSKYIGLIIVMTGFVGFMYLAITNIIGIREYSFLMYLIVTIYILSGMQFIVLWFIGNYIGRIYFQQKHRPTYIVRKRIGL